MDDLSNWQIFGLCTLAAFVASGGPIVLIQIIGLLVEDWRYHHGK